MVGLFRVNSAAFRFLELMYITVNSILTTSTRSLLCHSVPTPKEGYIKSAQFLSLFCFSYNDIFNFCSAIIDQQFFNKYCGTSVDSRL